MKATTDNGTRNEVKTVVRKFSFFASEAVLQFALVVVVVLALVDGALSIGGGTIA
ncbi:MAG TPA: hypothetical protein VKA43_03335 [Gammaproteobacteria bacterium]|nr:hypothetical protein [Gammaproteobacteria bacterium]